MVVRRATKVTGARRARALAGLCLMLVACGSGSAPAEPAVDAPDVFDEQRAFADLRDLVALGERPAGSEGAARTRTLLRERLRQAGWVVREQAFRVDAPDGSPVEMVNVIARRDGRGDGRVMLVTHYDTKRLPGQRFVGANDGASGVAVLLEVARQLAARPLGPAVELVFFDGEEAFGESITPRDGLYGSRALAEAMAADGTLDEIRALVLVDMVGDADLQLVRDQGSSPALRRRLQRIAAARGLESVLAGPTLHVVDDHKPFADRGVREVLALIDFQYGADWSPGPHWHTAADTLDKVSPESLNSVGVLVVELLGQLASSGRTEGADRP